MWLCSLRIIPPFFFQFIMQILIATELSCVLFRKDCLRTTVERNTDAPFMKILTFSLPSPEETSGNNLVLSFESYISTHSIIQRCIHTYKYTYTYIYIHSVQGERQMDRETEKKGEGLKLVEGGVLG